MKIQFIFNPRSGRAARNSRLLPLIKTFIDQRRLDARISITEHPGHATELALKATAAGYDRIVAVGGDGTMNEVAQGVLESPSTLALIPCGSGNGLALHLGIPTQPGRALELSADLSAITTVIDTGVANERPFFNAMGIGFDAEISRRFNQLTRRGLPAYVVTTLRALRDFEPLQATIRNGTSTHEMTAMLIAVANSDQYGNNAVIAPHASVNDGKLDLVAVKPVGFFGAAGLAMRLFRGTFDRSPNVLRITGTHFIVERKAHGLIHTDGETHLTAANVEISVRPRSLRLLVPATARVSERNPAPISESVPSGHG